MSGSPNDLADEIERTLRGLIHVPRVNVGGPVARRKFWSRCHLVTSNWRDENHRYIFVDGFVGASKWNSWKVFTDAIEDGLTLWMGYALRSGQWHEHAWCMLNNRIVETCWADRIYFGAMLIDDEIEAFGKEYGEHDLLDRSNLHVATFVDGMLESVPYDPKEHRSGIGRERDMMTREIRKGLGR